jgi:hypothetical protein
LYEKTELLARSKGYLDPGQQHQLPSLDRIPQHRL